MAAGRAAADMLRVAGHRAGLATARRIVEHASDTGIRCLTLYAFSSDNWRRPPAEVDRIFWLLRAFLRLETERMRQRGARLEVIGRRDRLSPAVLRSIETAEAPPRKAAACTFALPSTTPPATPLFAPLKHASNRRQEPPTPKRSPP